MDGASRTAEEIAQRARGSQVREQSRGQITPSNGQITPSNGMMTVSFGWASCMNFWEPCLSAMLPGGRALANVEKRGGLKSCGWLCDHASPPATRLTARWIRPCPRVDAHASRRRSTQRYVGTTRVWRRDACAGASRVCRRQDGHHVAEPHRSLSLSGPPGLCAYNCCPITPRPPPPGPRAYRRLAAVLGAGRLCGRAGGTPSQRSSFS